MWNNNQTISNMIILILQIIIELLYGYYIICCTALFKIIAFLTKDFSFRSQLGLFSP